MKAKKESGGRSECCEGQTKAPGHSCPESASQNPPAPVADSVLTAQAILQKELAAQKNDYVRLAADFANFKKRTLRDAERQAAAGKEAFIGDLLPVLDSLERALASGRPISSEQLHQGVERTLQQLGQLLHRHGIEAVEDIGQLFDPHRHEAVFVRHDPRQPDRIILEVAQRGYCCDDHVFRAAKVIVNDLSNSPGARHAT